MSVTPLELPEPDVLATLTLLPVPASAPPYDDERTGPVLVGPPAEPLGPLRSLPPLRLVPVLDEPEPVPARTPAEDLPPVRPVAHALVQGLLEVLAGVRPLTQLRRRTTIELYERLEELVETRPRPTGPRPSPGAVRSVHVQARPEGVAEVCATVLRGRRAGAVALRLEGLEGRWCCTDVEGL
jgi:hypothetical protein